VKIVDFVLTVRVEMTDLFENIVPGCPHGTNRLIHFINELAYKTSFNHFYKNQFIIPLLFSKIISVLLLMV